MDSVYSITRNGLRDLSNSHLMTAGAAFGEGIYCTQTFATASLYAAPCKFYTDEAENYQVIFVIEVVNVPSFIKTHIVITDDNACRLRFLLFVKQSGGRSQHAPGDLTGLAPKELQSRYAKVDREMREKLNIK